MDSKQVPMRYLGKSLMIDIRQLTEPCKAEEEEYVRTLHWIIERGAASNFQKYIAQPDEKLKACYESKVLTQLNAMQERLENPGN